MAGLRTGNLLLPVGESEGERPDQHALGQSQDREEPARGLAGRERKHSQESSPGPGGGERRWPEKAGLVSSHHRDGQQVQPGGVEEKIQKL